MNYALILAGGVGNRMQMDIPKQYMKILGKPVLVYTLERFEDCDLIDEIVLVANENWHEKIRHWVQKYHITKFRGFALPGDSRQESVFSGLDLCMSLSHNEEDVVIVHESARPLLSEDLLQDIILNLKGHDACIPVLPMKDAVIFSQTGSTIDNLIDRNKLFCGQAPECFYLHRYWQINQNTPRQTLRSIRADHELCFSQGWDVCCIPGEEYNFKLTTPEDVNRMITLIRDGRV